MKKIGVLAVQGAVREHVRMLNQITDVQGLAVKYETELDEIDGLIIPGGESTAIGRLLRDFDLLDPLKEKIQKGLPVWGTCAGMILLAKKLVNDDTSHLGVMDIEVARNGYGRQLGSFETVVNVPEVAVEDMKLTFIRAPYVNSAGSEVRILLKVDDRIVACRQNNMLATAFHPELTEDLAWHRYFVRMVRGH
ncbi:MAG: pyridoxal 5'-phosphate synthase glutaminase subunit PdxT [Defluviitaleaceae bacterium]|nr:pyridoxal 5'-phosphate synthase glutaminase subunit PdxT [Defluviitaleaceae bacterium]